MFKWLGQRQGKGNHKTNGASIQSLIQKAVTDAEQISASIKTRAQEEAENEAAMTIEQAKQQAEQIKKSAGVAAQKEAEDILSSASKRAETAEIDAKQKVRLLLLKAKQELDADAGGEYKQVLSRLISSLQELVNEEQGEVITQSVLLEEEAINKKVEEPVQLEREPAVSEPIGAINGDPSEQSLPTKKPDEVTPGTTQLRLEDSQALYAGEIELIIAAPVELKTLTKLYNYLQTTPDIKILYTRGSWDSGTNITVSIDNPVPLISFLLKIPGVSVVPELYQRDNPVKEISSSLLRARRNGIKRIKLTLKEK